MDVCELKDGSDGGGGGDGSKTRSIGQQRAFLQVTRNPLYRPPSGSSQGSLGRRDFIRRRGGFS